MGHAIVVADGISPLAWIVECGGAPRIVVGAGVDVRDRDGRLQVTEGAWEADFASSDVAEARHLFGSGFVLSDERMLFCTASHMLEALYVLRGARGAVVSNSLAFLVRYCRLDLDGAPGLVRKAQAAMMGLDADDRVIWRKGGEEIDCYAYCNFRLRGGRVERSDKGRPPAFADYRGYRDYMLETLSGVRDNAAAAGRTARYSLLASVSSGYDSVACAALGSIVGCDRAVSVRSARSGPVDSGKPVADALGIECIERERRIAVRPGERDVEADFVASFDAGDIVYKIFEDVLPRSLLLTGHHGDAVWSLTDEPHDRIRRLGATGAGLHEYRLRKDFVTVPPAFIGALRHSDIQRISLSDEMRPWSIGGVYDRPVPRRIAEEAGVPRALFGQRKMAVNMSLWQSERLVTPETLAAIEAYVRRRVERFSLVGERAFRGVQFLLDLTSGNIKGRLGAFFNRIGFLRRRARPLNRAFRSRWGVENRAYYDHVYVWALSKVGERYDPALTGAPRKAGLPAASGTPEIAIAAGDGLAYRGGQRP